ncbi:hypothetical protein MCAV_03690 [[Mycoplasma] cavipharyngis]
MLLNNKTLENKTMIDNNLINYYKTLFSLIFIINKLLNLLIIKPYLLQLMIQHNLITFNIEQF